MATSSGGLPGRTATPYVHFIRAQLQQGLVIEKPQMIEMLYKEPTLAERFLTHMLTRNIRIEEEMVGTTRSRQLLHEQVPRARVHRIQRDITVNSSLLTVVPHD